MIARSLGLSDSQSSCIHRDVQARRGEEQDVDSEQFQDPDNEFGLFAGTTYEADDKEADRIYEQVNRTMDARRRARCEARERNWRSSSQSAHSYSNKS